MRRILLAFMTTLAGVVVLFNYRTSTAHLGSTGTAAVAVGGSGTGSGTSATPAAPKRSSTPSSLAASGPISSSGTSRATRATSTKTVTGATAHTRWGPVQVQITVTGGKITNVNAVQVPSGNSHDIEINKSAVPALIHETLQAQSAHIDGVSGATVTSDGYITSLQSALDRAGR